MSKRTARTKKPTIDARQVDVTTEYDVFKRLPGNRDVSEVHVVNLMQAMRENDLFTPILVNQEFEVIDGQHRLEARKRLGLSVPYYWTEDLGLAEVQRLNSTAKSWTNSDHTKAYIELGNQHYVQYDWFRRKYGLPHIPSLMLLYGGGAENMADIFKSGRFKVKDLEGAKTKADMLAQIAPHFDHWKAAGFVKAFLYCLARTGFDFKTFLHRVKQNPTLMKPCTSIDSYMLMIEEVYNYRSTKKVPLRFAPEAPVATANH